MTDKACRGACGKKPLRRVPRLALAMPRRAGIGSSRSLVQSLFNVSAFGERSRCCTVDAC